MQNWCVSVQPKAGSWGLLSVAWRLDEGKPWGILIGFFQYSLVQNMLVHWTWMVVQLFHCQVTTRPLHTMRRPCSVWVFAASS